MTVASAILKKLRLSGLPASGARRASMVALFVVLAGASTATAATVKRFEAPEQEDVSEALSIAAGADGNLWLGQEGYIARMTPSGAVTTFAGGIRGNGPLEVAAGPDGNIWFTNFDADRVGRITPSGKITEFSRGIRGRGRPLEIAAGPDGNMWFTEPGRGVARITPTGRVTQFSAGITPNSGLSGITAGPDGNVWFGVLADRPRIARVTPSGNIKQFSGGRHMIDFPFDLAAGPDGNVWFTYEARDSIGRITPSGKITDFSAGISPGAEPYAIAAGPDGNLWFTEYKGGRLARITPTGNVTEFSAGLPSGELLSPITAGPDASLWFTTFGGVGRLTPTPGTAVSMLTQRARVSHRGATTIKLACGAGTESCSGRLELTIRVTKREGSRRRDTYRETVVLAKTRFALSPGQHATLKLALNRIGRRHLARAKGRLLKTRYRAGSSAGDAKGALTLTAPRRARQSTH